MHILATPDRDISSLTAGRSLFLCAFASV
ncbi:hypothetical protein KL86DPRO_10565 [uncultured delta proteobacterium]|uniref:Uncharacterized protein n=1 Tax=uncultured delta proteobacterium TaxID=34034 RepID=A0A212J2J9_9DELT|nr:hypothetical protein KL86DPRO_10565 [uncultured delta proteobacterium]